MKTSLIPAVLFFFCLLPAISFAQDRTYYTGSKGGCYYLTAAGKKVYVDKSYCSQPSTERTKLINKKPTESSSDSGGTRTYYRGPRGGCYYLDRNGKKVYVDKDKCD
jgi:hypothetical protein